MTTPAYTPHSSTNLSASTVGTSVPVNAQTNDNAIVDELTLLGMLGWAVTITRTGNQVTQVIAAKGVFQTRVVYTYVPSGPATGKLQDATHSWSNDSGASWALRTDTGVTNGKQTFNYDGSGNLTSVTWS